MRSSVRQCGGVRRLRSRPADRLSACSLLGLASTPAAAQETGGSIAGTISDAQSATLPGVSVSLRNEDTNAQLQTVTNGEGAYVLPFVPIGRYTLTVTLSGFSTTKREGIEVRVGDRLRLDLAMQLGAVTEEVTVRSEAPLLDTGSANRGQVINREQVADLPLLGRNPVLARAAVAGRAVHAGARPAARTARSTTAAWTTSRSAAAAASPTSSCSTACRTPAPRRTSPTT